MIIPAAESKWKFNMSSLAEYTSQSSGIKINRNTVVIPGEHREKFYHLFDAAGDSYILSRFLNELEQAEKLSKSYKRLESRLMQSLELENINMLSDIFRFLHDPFIYLRRPLKSLIFNYLKGDIDISDFDELACKSIISTYAKLFQAAYEIWIALAITSLLEPEACFQVSLAEFESIERTFHDGMPKKPPFPQASKSINFAHSNTVFIVPDLIVNSKRIGEYVAICVNPRQASTKAKELSSSRKWIHIGRDNTFDSEIMIYVDRDINNLAVVADRSMFAVPEVMVGCLTSAQDFNQKLEAIKINLSELSPSKGAYITSPIIFEKLESPEIKYLATEYDENKLGTIIEALLPKN